MGEARSMCPIPRFRRLGAAVLAVALLVPASGCGRRGGVLGDLPPPQQRDFVVRVGEERFVIRLVTAEQIAAARAILAGTQPQRIVIGQLADGGGGYNRDPVAGRTWSWHMVPETISFVDLAIELCDGLPSDVEANKSYWLNTVGQFCPWASQLDSELGG